jgi:hypothetical protein
MCASRCGIQFDLAVLNHPEAVFVENNTREDADNRRHPGAPIWQRHVDAAYRVSALAAVIGAIRVLTR